MRLPSPNQDPAPNRRPAGQSDGSDNLSAIVAADRAFPAVAELGSFDRAMNALMGPGARPMISPLRFPTEMHRQVAELAGDFFSAHAHVDTILVVNSCARGRAVAGSDLDLAVLITPAAASQEVQSLTTLWQKFIATQPLIHRFRSTGRFNQVHLDVFDGRVIPTVWDDGGGPDYFEVEIGNRLAYAVPLHEAGAYFRQLRSQWLPYYGEDLRLSRLAMVREACARDLEAIPST